MPEGMSYTEAERCGLLGPIEYFGYCRMPIRRDKSGGLYIVPSNHPAMKAWRTRMATLKARIHASAGGIENA